MLDELDETFMVSNGDLLTSMDLAPWPGSTLETGCDASIGVFERENKIDFGLIEFDAEKRLCAYREKPTSMYYVSMGIYILQREAIAPADCQGRIPRHALASAEDARCRSPTCAATMTTACGWTSAGRMTSPLAQSMFEQNRALFLEH